jgi:phosphopantetheine--protein transferase-like protein
VIHGIGTDIVKISRFSEWHKFSDVRLKKIFHDREIKHFRLLFSKNEKRACEFFASRFAVKEAVFKSVSDLFQIHGLSFLHVGRLITVEKNELNVPKICIHYSGLDLRDVKISVSLTHDGGHAIAFVVVETVK